MKFDVQLNQALTVITLYESSNRPTQTPLNFCCHPSVSSRTEADRKITCMGQVSVKVTEVSGERRSVPQIHQDLCGPFEAGTSFLDHPGAPCSISVISGEAVTTSCSSQDGCTVEEDV